MTHTEARRFALFCKFVWHSCDGLYSYQLYSKETEQLLWLRYKIDSSLYYLLKEIGLIESAESSAIVLSKYPPGPPVNVRYGNDRFKIWSDHDSIGVHVRVLTSAGRQLYELCDAKTDPEYLEAIRQSSDHIHFDEAPEEGPIFGVAPRHALLLD